MPEFKARLRTPRLPAAPATPISGELYYDTVANQLYVYNGAAWIKVILLDASGNLAMGGAYISFFGGTLYNYILEANAAGDTTNRFTIQNSGHLFWGPGGTTATDTNLYRAAVNQLKTDGSLLVCGTVYAFKGSADANSQMAMAIDFAGAGLPALLWGPGGASGVDTWLYRTGTGGGLATSGGLSVLGAVTANGPAANSGAFLSSVGSDTNYRYQLTDDGSMAWGPGNAATDVTLSRLTNNQLYTNGSFQAAGGMVVDRSNAGNAFYFGSALDTYLVRTGTNALATSGQFGTGAQLNIGASAASTAAIYVQQLAASGFFAAVKQAPDTGWRFLIDANGQLVWGPGGSAATDTTLYRFNANQLGTGGDLVVNKSIYMGYGGGAEKIFFGNAVDTDLYRSAAGVLKTDQNFHAGLDLYAQDGGATQVRIGNNSGRATVDFGSAMDTTLYRQSAGVLKTDGVLNAVGGLQINGVPVAGSIPPRLGPLTANVPGGDCNLITDTGWYNGSALANTPAGRADWLFIEHISHINGTPWYTQICWTMQVNPVECYTRSCVGSTTSWTPWTRLGGGGGATVGTTFPASPATGQVFILNSGTTFVEFVWDGAHWYSQPMMVLSNNSQNTTTSTSMVALFGAGPFNITGPIGAGCTVQMRCEGYFSNAYTGNPGDASQAGILQAGYQTAALSGSLSGITWLAGTNLQTPNPNFQQYYYLSSPWVDGPTTGDGLVPYAGGQRSGGGTGYTVWYNNTTVWMRFRK